MSYQRRVEMQREENRRIEEKRKKAKEAARRAGIAGLGLSAVRRAAVQPEDGPGFLKRMLNAMDPRTWKSKKTIAHEAEVARKKAEQEAAEAKKIGEGK